MNRSFSPALWLVAASFLGFVMFACDVEEGGKYNFPHKPHIEAEVSCDSCHELQEGQVSFPNWETCLTCHETGDEIFNRCNACHQEVKVEVTEKSVVTHQEFFKKYLGEGWKDVKLDHAAHLTAESDCLACHGAVKGTESSSLKNLPTMEIAMTAVRKDGLSTDCNLCHLDVNLLTPPASHNAQWKKNHGFLSEFSRKDRCLLCHEEATCITCHRTEQPASHTNLWRRRTHGIEASFDRSQCFVCHRNDECISCHRSTADPVPPAVFHTPDAQCMACHSPQGAVRPANRYLKPMPHRLMMGLSSQKCLECHSF